MCVRVQSYIDLRLDPSIIHEIGQSQIQDRAPMGTDDISQAELEEFKEDYSIEGSGGLEGTFNGRDISRYIFQEKSQEQVFLQPNDKLSTAKNSLTRDVGFKQPNGLWAY